MDASLQIQGNIHDDKLIVQFVRLCPEYWVHIKIRCQGWGFHTDEQVHRHPLQYYSTHVNISQKPSP